MTAVDIQEEREARLSDGTKETLAAHPLRSLFCPRSVAVIGASSNPAKAGNRICRQLLAEGYDGDLVPVSLGGKPVAGIQSIKSLREHGKPIDVAVITTATEQVADALRDCVAMQVKFAIVHTAGFGETGAEGRALERELVEIASAGNLRIVGPNCMQIYNASARLNLIGTPFPSGSIAMISQSGNLVRAVTEEFEPNGLGFSSFVTVGNQADLKIHEYLDYLREDPQTRVVFLYIEGIVPGTGAELLRVARATVAEKPVVVLKGGVTNAGARSTLSHTGAIAGEARVLAAAMRQAGVLMLERFDEVVPILDALSRLPLPKGRRIGVVGGGGGHATLCADALERVGLEVPVLSEAVQQKVAEHLPSRAATRNPIDFTGASEREIAVYAKVPEIVLEQDTDAALLYGLYAGYRTDLERPGNTYVETSALIVDMVQRQGKPAIMQTVYARRDHPSLTVLRKGGVPVMESVDHAAAGLAALCKYAEFRTRARTVEKARPEPGQRNTLLEELAAKARTRRACNITEVESLGLLADIGVPIVPHRSAESFEAIAAAAEEIGYPVVLKASSPDLVHKSDAGGVALDLRDREALEAAHRRITATTGTKTALVAAYRPGGVEVIIGAFRDPTFGPVLAFGLGGTAVEAIDDVSLRVLPIDREEAMEMLHSIRGHRLLGPLRGKPAVDREGLVRTLVEVGRLMHSNDEIAEIDLNPVLAFPEGVLVADARIVIREQAGTERL